MVVASPVPLAKHLSSNSIEENSVLTFNYIDKDPIKERKKKVSFQLNVLNPPNQGFHCSALKALTPIFHVSP